MYTIIVVGCGGTGSNLIALLSQYAISERKIKNIILVDGDKVEEKNFRKTFPQSTRFLKREARRQRLLQRRH